MDCNNYSYSGGGTTCRYLSSSDGLVILSLECNYFNEWSYDVENLLEDDSFKTFYIGSSLDHEKQKKAYKEAAAYFNTLVPENEVIPMF